MNELDELVSVVVVSYNAEKTIIDTLDSIKAQSYHNIELIVTDDCSTDNTVPICESWLKQNKARFTSYKLLVSPTNQGVCKNGNAGNNQAHGKWIKTIAADDRLKKDCISDNIEFVKNHPEADFVASCMSVYKDSFEEDNCIEEKKGPKDVTIFSQPLNVQLKRMAYSTFIYAPATFYSSDLFRSVGGFEEKYMYDDAPFYMNILEKGYLLYYLDKVTVDYRIHNSQSNLASKLFNYSFTIKTIPYFKDKCFKYYTKRKIISTKGRWWIERTMYMLGLDEAKPLNRFIYNVFLWTLARIGGK